MLLAVSRVIRHFTLWTLLLTLGVGQWALLQSAAWAGMLAGHLRSQSFAVAVSQTFDGDHPCAMCKVIQKQKSSDKKTDFDGRVDRINLIKVPAICILPNDRPGEILCCSDEFGASITTPPLHRPPRFARV